MNIQELFRRLSYGPLSNLSMSGEGTGAILDDAKPKLISYANEGLLRLHSRFLLRESTLAIQVINSLTYYYMLKRFARSEITDPPCPNTPYSYILDSTDEPFQDDLLKILKVTGIDGKEFTLNDNEDRLSLFTPQPNLLQIPIILPDELLSIQYQARHPTLDYADETQEMDLPFALEGALVAFVAGEVFSHMNGADNSAKGAEHMNRFEGICMEVEATDLISQSVSSIGSKFQQRGFI